MSRAPLLALLLALVPAAAAGQDEEARGRPEILRIDFVGNETFATDSLKRAIVNRETECRSLFLVPFCELDLNFADDRHYFHADEFARDAVRLRLYYWQRGFREARVDTASARSGDEVELTFTIVEGRPVRVDTIAILGGEDLADPGLLANLPIREGERLNGILVEASRDTLEARLRDAGHAHALVLLRTELPSGSYEAAVTFDVDPGPLARFGDIDIRGNRELSDEVVRRMIGFTENDLYGTTSILQAQRNLFSLEIVQYARVSVDSLALAAEDTILPVRVDVTEGDEYRVRTGAGWSTAECLASEGQWTARNFLGGARRLQVRARLSNVLAESLRSVCYSAGTGDYGRLNWLAAVDFNQPWIFSPRNALSVGVYAERTSLPDVFVRKAVGLNLVLTRTLGPATSLALSYRPQLSRLEAAEVFFCTSFLACAPEDIDVIQGANWLAPVGVSLSTDRTDNVLNPRSGWRAAFDVEHASSWTGSNYAYNRAFAEGSGYRGVGASVAAARLRAGWVGPGEFALLQGDGVDVVHPQKRFFAGGSNSVRGFAQNRLGPKVLTVSLTRLVALRDDTLPGVCTPEQIRALTCDASALEDGDFVPQPTGGTRVIEGNLEYRFPITPVAFEGVGFLDFGNVWAESEDLEVGDLRWTPGLGVRYYSPIGPIRLDLGYRFSGGESLQVVTSRIRPFDPAVDDEDDRLVVGTDEAGDDITIPWVRGRELALLEPRVPFDQSTSFFRRLQLHFSIGQAF